MPPASRVSRSLEESKGVCDLQLAYRKGHVDDEHKTAQPLLHRRIDVIEEFAIIKAQHPGPGPSIISEITELHV